MKRSYAGLSWLLILAFAFLPLIGQAAQAPSTSAAAAAPAKEIPISKEKPKVRKKRYLRKALGYGVVGIALMFLGSWLTPSTVGIIILVGGSLLFFFGAYNLIQWFVKGGAKKKKKFDLSDIFQKKS